MKIFVDAVDDVDVDDDDVDYKYKRRSTTLLSLMLCGS